MRASDACRCAQLQGRNAGVWQAQPETSWPAASPRAAWGFEFAGTAPGASAAAPARRVMGVARQAIATHVGALTHLVPTRT